MTGGADAPRNMLEQAVVDARAGRITQIDFVRALVHSDVFVLSSTPVEADGSGLRPLLHQGEPGSEARVALFTHADHAGNAARLTNTPYLLQINGLAFLKRVPPTLGIALNPDSTIDLRADIDSAGVQRIVQDADKGVL